MNLYNPHNLSCGCPPECIRQRNMVGRLLRWYIPGRYHTPVAPADKARLEAEQRSFRAS
jgi:hypothetical protein